MPLSTTLTVSKLNEYVSSLFSRDPVLRELSVQGEISGFKRHSSGHLYFSLKDEGAIVRCVMFRQAAQSLAFQPVDGMQVILHGYASLYTRDGQFQLYARALERGGEGELYRKFCLLKTKLEQKGYFLQDRKRVIPFLPKRVGIITSPTGAALQDILNIIRRRFPLMDIVFYPVAVQGQSAAAEIASAIRLMNMDARADVIIVGRGGGSIEELWAFNEEVVAEAIFESSIPVISAVGHETDFTIADFVADVRAPTPSAAAELAVPLYDALLQQSDQLSQRLAHSLQVGVERKQQKLQFMLRTKSFDVVKQRLELNLHTLSNVQYRMQQTASAIYIKNLNSLKTLLARLETLGPSQVLQRGYALVRSIDGRALDSVDQVRPDERLSVQMKDGAFFATVETIQLNQG